MKTVILSQKLYLRLIFIGFFFREKKFYIKSNFLSKLTNFLKLTRFKKLSWKIEDIKNNDQILLTEIIEKKRLTILYINILTN